MKPGNLLLERTGVIKVLDMGLARFFNKQQDSVTEKYDDKCVLGTADYLAPEQAVSSSVDIRADIYSLGGTFYYMLTGQTPFPDGTIAAKLVAHQTREPKAIEEYRADVPPGMVDVLRIMMSKDANDRYQEPIEVAEALAEWADLPMEPPPQKEMPGLCPLVLSLTGHSADKMNSTTSAVPLGRAIFGPGRGAMRLGGSSARHAAARPVGVASAVETARVNGNKSRNGSTIRTAASTTPLPTRTSRKPAVPEVEPADAAPVSRIGGRLLIALFVALGFALAAGAAVGAFYLGRANPEPATTISTPAK